MSDALSESAGSIGEILLKNISPELLTILGETAFFLALFYFSAIIIKKWLETLTLTEKTIHATDAPAHPSVKRYIYAPLYVFIVVLVFFAISALLVIIANREPFPTKAIKEAIFGKISEEGIVQAQYDLAKALFNLGVMYERDDEGTQDYEKAAKWYQEAADQGIAEAQYNLGVMYERGEGVPQDDEKAMELYREAAYQGLAKAQFNLGDMYYSDDGVPQDYKKAVFWYQEAADQGFAKAQNNLGVMYRKGRGVKRRIMKKRCSGIEKLPTKDMPEPNTILVGCITKVMG